MSRVAKPMPAHRHVAAKDALEAVLWTAILVGTFFALDLAAGRARGDDAEPTDRAFVLVSVSPEPPRTWEILTVAVRSKVWSVDTYGNATLVPNPGYVNVTLYARLHDVRIASRDAPFLNGTAIAEFVVDPEWSDLWVVAEAADPVSGLRGELAFRTEYSMSYLLWKVENVWMPAFGAYARELSAQHAAERNFERAMWVFAFAAFFAMLLTVFLRTEHRKARAHAVSSMWDLLADKFPFSLVPEDLWIAMDPRRAPSGYKELADRWTRHRREAAVARIEDERVRLEKAKDFVYKGLIDA